MSSKEKLLLNEKLLYWQGYHVSNWHLFCFGSDDWGRGEGEGGGGVAKARLGKQRVAGGRFKIWKMPHVLPEECDFPPPQEKMFNFVYEKPHFVPNNNAKWIASEILKLDGKHIGYYFFGVSSEVD